MIRAARSFAGLRPTGAFLCAALLVAAPRAAFAAPPDPDGEWRIGPAFLTEHTTIYDPASDRMIVFGGSYPDGSFSNDVFALELTGTPRWTPILPQGSPPAPRAGHTAIYDPVRHRMIVFGGTAGTPKYNDVWELTLSGSPEWHPLSPLGARPPNWDHAAIYDPLGDRMIVVGGAGWDSDHAVWALPLSGTPAWSEVIVAGLAEVFFQHTMVYDPLGHRAIVLGTNAVQTFSLSGPAAWSYLPSSSAVQSNQTAIYDPVGHRVVVYGGGDGVFASPRAAALALGSSTWAELAPGRQRMQHAAIHDPVRNRMLAYGGRWVSSMSADNWNDVQALSLTATPAWSPVSAGPGRSVLQSAVWDPARDQVVTFGGCVNDGFMGGCSPSNGAWSLSAGLLWSGIAPAGSPPDAQSAAIHDPLRDRMLVIGSAPSSAVWSLTLAEPRTWTTLATDGTPPGARTFTSAIYDPVRDRMLIFGGSAAGNPLQDLWALSLSGTPTWTLLTPSGTPPAPRSAHVAAYDPVRDRMIVFGGDDGTYLSDVWALELGGAGQWVQIVPAGTAPSPRSLAAAGYDARRDRLIVHGGHGAGGAVFGDAFALNLGGPAWSPLTPSGVPPSARFGHAAVYDEDRDRMILLGGEPRRDDVWVLNFADQVEVEPIQRSLQLSAALPNPTRAGATFVLDLPSASVVRAEIFDLAGRRLARLAHGRLDAGRHLLRWDGTTTSGSRAAAGLYYVRVAAGAARLGRSLVVLN